MSRFTVDRALSRRRRSVFPLATLLVNTVGSFVLGVALGASGGVGLGATTGAVLGTGFCGGFTTFSTFTVDTVRLVEADRVGLAARNVAASLAAGLPAAAFGLWLGS